MRFKSVVHVMKVKWEKACNRLQSTMLSFLRLTAVQIHVVQSQVVLLLSGLVLFASLACAPSTAKLPEASGVVFRGIQRVEAIGNGRWRIIWAPVTDLADTSYLVFERSEAGGNYDFTQPISRTDENFFVTSDLRLFESKCYVVRSLVKGEAAEQNKNEVCTGHQAFVFNGLRDLQPLEKGNYLISWNLSPYSKREMSYEIRERKRGQKVWAVAGTTIENFFPTRVVNIEEVVCFNVRYIHSSLKKDSNEKEVCTDEENTGNFTGIKEIIKADDEKGGYHINWEKSARDDVIGYRIFKGVQLKDLIAEVGPFESGYRVNGLGRGATYEFGVRLVTRSGREDGNNKTLRLTVENDLPVVQAVKVESIERVNLEGKTVRDKLSCSATFIDPDRSHGKVYPRIEFKAQLTTGEKPIILRERIVGDPVVLDAKGVGTFSALYTLNSSKDRRGSDLFCEVTVFDGIDPSLPVRSQYIVLPDSAPIATGIFISKKVYFDQNSGTTHYYDRSVGGEPGQMLSKVVKGEVVAENHACMIAGLEGAIQNKNTLDICEDTVVQALVKKVIVPIDLLEPGKESELFAFRKNIAYADGSLGDDYQAFYANINNRAKLGYYDPDDADIASRIEVRDVKNGTVASARCLEGVCNINFVLAKDYNSGSDLGDKDGNGEPYKHAELFYRVRTYEPVDETSCASLDGIPCSELGWSTWAPLKIEVTAVDEEPRITGITVKGTEDRVQKVVFCNQRRNDPAHVAPDAIDPECLLDKTITLNSAFDPTRQDESFKYVSGQGFGYFDLEDDPMVRVLPDALVPASLGAWVLPVVPNPNLENRSHWQAVQSIPLTAAEACDQTAIDSVTGQPNFCPFHCNKEQSKCFGYFMPAVDVHSQIELGYDLWVEVDPVANPDPSFAGLVGSQREVKAAQPGKIFLEIEKVNDPADLASINEPNWFEDEHDGTPHQIFFKRVTSYLANSVAGAIYVPYYDPDIVRNDNGQAILSKSDMLRRSVDMEVRFLEGGAYKTSYCDTPSVPRTSTNDYPGVQVSFPNICTLNVGKVSYRPVPPSDDAGTVVETMAKMRLSCSGNGDCDGEMIYPDHYHGALSFQYRIQTTRLNENGDVVLDTTPDGDWSPWKDVELVTQPVADPPRTFNVSLGGQDSYRATIREDLNFIVKMVKGKGIGGYNILVPGADITEQRFYEGYFDVDETDDIAHTVVVTNVKEYTVGEPVLLDKDGNAILGDDGLPINSSATGNSTAFSCDNNGDCVAEFRSAENFFVPDGQADPYFEYIVKTHPKSFSDRAEPMVPFKPVRDLTSPIGEKGKFSFNIAPVDDAPGLTGAGGIALPEDSPTVFIVSKSAGEGEIGYSEIEEWNIAEKIEIANIVYYDPAIASLLLDKDSLPNGMGYPDGTANGYPGSALPGAPDIFVPPAINRGAPGSLTDRLIIRGEDFSNHLAGTEPFKVNEEDVDDYLKAAEPSNNLPDRWQFLCRRSADADLSAGECWIEVRSPLHFNTGSAATSATDPRSDALRVASFDFRIFTRDPNLWKPPEDSEDGGSWSDWTTIRVKFDPVNDAPVFQGNLDLETLTRDGQTGIMSAANPWRVNEGTEDYLEFKWGQHYTDPDYSTESYTYKEDIATDALPPFLPSDMRYSSRFLATKLSVSNLSMRSFYFQNKSLMPRSAFPFCRFGQYHRKEAYSLIYDCKSDDEIEEFAHPTIAMPTRSYQSSTSRAATLTSTTGVGSTFEFVHNLDADWAGFQGWKVYNNTDPFSPLLLSQIDRDARFEVDLVNTTNNKVVFKRKMAPDAVAGANVKFELGLANSLVSQNFTGVNVNDTFDFDHTLNVPFAGENSWTVYDTLGNPLSTAQRNSSIELVDTNKSKIRFRKIGPLPSTDFRIDVRFPQHWVQSYNGDFYGLPAPDNLVTSESNINCDPEGNCRLGFALPFGFIGNITADVRLADGSSAPKFKDWTADSEKKTIYASAVYVDDLPVMGTEDVVIDVLEDRIFEFGFNQKVNQPIFAESSSSKIGPSEYNPAPATRVAPVGSTGPAQTIELGGYGLEGAFYGEYTNRPSQHPTTPFFDLQAPAPWKFPPNFYTVITGKQCLDPGPQWCGMMDRMYQLVMVSDNDQNWFTAFDFLSVPDSTRVTFYDPGFGTPEPGLTWPGPGAPPAGWFPRQARPVPFTWYPAIERNRNQEYFGFQSVPNYYNARYNDGSMGRASDTGRPYEYITGPAGAGSDPWADHSAIDPAGKGDLYFDFKAKTFDGDETQTNNGIDCSVPANCYTGVGRVYVRVHPTDDKATIPNAIATTVNGVAVNVQKIFDIDEEEVLELTITPSDYIDPDYNANPGEGLAMGIGLCGGTVGGTTTKDSSFFTAGRTVWYEPKLEPVFKGTRLDPLASLSSLLRYDEMIGSTMSVSTGRVNQSGGAAVASYPVVQPPAGLASGCGFIPGATDADGAQPTGTCTLRLRPDSNIFGEFYLCTKVRTMPQRGDYLEEKDFWSEPIYVKVNINDLDDPPHAGQLAVRGRANEDHIAEVELGPTSFEWTRTGIKMAVADPAQLVIPGYWDFDADFRFVDTASLSGGALTVAQAVNSRLNDNLAEFIYVDMGIDSAQGYSGVGAGRIKFRSDPSTDRAVALNFDAQCSSFSGFEGTNTCRIPCESDGKCFFLFEPPADEPKAAGTGRFSMKWWLSAKGGKKLSSRREDNLMVNRAAGGLPGVKLGIAAGFVEADYASAEPLNNYDLGADLQCLNPGTIDLFQWRLHGVEEGELGGIPGSYLGQAFHPIDAPVYSVARPASQVPDPLRVKPHTSTVGPTKYLRLYRPGLIDSGKYIATGASGGAAPDDTLNGVGDQGAACGNREYGRLIFLIEPVSDKPKAKIISRTVSGSQSSLLSFTQSLASTADGYTDGDGDKPDHMTFLSDAQMKDGNGDYVGTLSLSPTPPAVPAGLTALTRDDNGTPGDTSDDRFVLPQELLISEPGCSVNNGDCSVYFHPKPGFNGVVQLDFTISTVGADAFIWESDRVGPDGPGRLTLNIVSTAPKITVIGGEPFEISEDASSGTLKITGGSSNVSVTVDESQTIRPEEDADEVVVSFESSDHTIIDPTKITFSRTDGAAGVDYDLGAEPGVIHITPEADRFNKDATEVTVTLRATETDSGLFSTASFQVKVLPVPDAPTIGVAPLAVNSPTDDYTVAEDGVLNITGIFVDEGGGVDENDEELSVTFSVDNPGTHAQIIDPATDIVLVLTDEATPNNDAGAVERTIVITPKPNMFTDSSGIIVTMSLDDNDGAGVPVTRSFKVVVTPVNDPPLVTAGLGASYLTATDTPLVLSGITLDEGGVLDGLGSENDQTVTWEFKVFQSDGVTEDITMINPATDIGFVGTADNTTFDSNALTKTLTITPSGFGLGSVVKLRLSDDGGTTWVDHSFTVDVRKPPRGPISCTAGGGVGSDEHIFGASQPISGVTCSGLTAALGVTDTYGTSEAKYEISSHASTTCATGVGGVVIDESTGVLSGAMPVADCTVLISGNDNSADSTKVPLAERALVRLLAAQVSAVAFSNPAISNTCSYSMDVTTDYHLGRSSFSSADPTVTGGGFTGQMGSDVTFTADLTDFTKISSTFGLTIYDTKGTSNSVSQEVDITPSDVEKLAVHPAAPLIAGLVSEGTQAGFNYEDHCVDNATCEAQSLAQIAAGGDHTCARKSDGALYCWGANDADGRLGLGVASGTPVSFDEPQLVAGETDVNALTLGKNHSCFITNAGALKCFGENDDGELGVGNFGLTTTATASTLAIETATAVQAAAVALGDNHTCYLGAGVIGTTPGAGKAYCSGRNDLDQLGYNTTGADSFGFAESAGVSGAVAIAAGKNHTCVLTGVAGSRQVNCWGSNSSNQLGEIGRSLGTTTGFAVAVDVVPAATLNTAVGIYAGGDSTCVVLADFSVRCWGSNSSGQLGDGTTADTDGDQATPTKAFVIPAGLDGTANKVVGLAVGETHGCALTDQRELFCFGENSNGQLGISSTSDALVPTKLTVGGAAEGVVAVSAGAGHTCFVSQNAKAHCMGKAALGALGDGQMLLDALVPTEVSGLTGFAPAVRQCKRFSVSFTP